MVLILYSTLLQNPFLFDADYFAEPLDEKLKEISVSSLAKFDKQFMLELVTEYMVLELPRKKENACTMA